MEDVAKYLLVFLMGLAPISEVRGAIPVARILFSGDGEFAMAVAAAVTGNLVIAPAVLWTLERIERIVIVHGGFLGRIYERALRLARKKSEKVKNYGCLGLVAFVAIPLPATGAWTGSLVAYLLGLPRTKSLLAIEVGVLTASAIVYAAVVLGLEVVKTLFLI